MISFTHTGTLSLQATAKRPSLKQRNRFHVHAQKDHGTEPSVCSHLYVIGKSVEESEPRDPLVAAHHARVLGVLTVGHADAVGRTERQRLLSPTAVQVVEPDGS